MCIEVVTYLKHTFCNDNHKGTQADLSAHLNLNISIWSPCVLTFMYVCSQGHLQARLKQCDWADGIPASLSCLNVFFMYLSFMLETESHRHIQIGFFYSFQSTNRKCSPHMMPFFSSPLCRLNFISMWPLVWTYHLSLHLSTSFFFEESIIESSVYNEEDQWNQKIYLHNVWLAVCRL